MGREHDRIGPLEADLGRVAVEHPLGPDGDETDLLGAVVVALEGVAAAGRRADRADEHDVRIVGLDRDVAALGGTRRVAVAPRDGAHAGAARHRDRGVVLLASVDHVRELVVDVEVVELRGRLVVDRRPRVAGGERHPGTAVVGADHAVGILRIDPEAVVVAVGCDELGELVATVDRLPRLHVEHEHRVGVGRMGDDVHVVPGPPRQLGLARGLDPRVAVIVAAVQAALTTFGFDHRPHPTPLGGRDGDADLAERAVGQTRVLREVRPGVAAVVGAPQTRARTAGVDRPERAAGLPGGGEDAPRVRRVEREIDGAGLLTDVEDELPRVAAVGRAVDAPLGVVLRCVAERGHVDEVGVVRVHEDLADVAGLLEAGMGPRRAPIAGAVDAVAVADVDADRRFAGAGVDHVRIRLGDRERTDRARVQEAVGDALPVGACVVGAPHATGDGAEVEDAALVGITGHRHDTTAPGRADASVTNRAEERGVNRHGSSWVRGGGGREQRH